MCVFVCVCVVCVHMYVCVPYVCVCECVRSYVCVAVHEGSYTNTVHTNCEIAQSIVSCMFTISISSHKQHNFICLLIKNIDMYIR